MNFRMEVIINTAILLQIIRRQAEENGWDLKKHLLWQWIDQIKIQGCQMEDFTHNFILFIMG